jgi:hypothetical protein
MIDNNRVKRLIISTELLFSLFTEGEHAVDYSVLQDAIPADAELVKVNVYGYGTSYREIVLVIRSNSFPHVPEGQTIPILKPVIENINATAIGMVQWLKLKFYWRERFISSFALYCLTLDRSQDGIC